jgi:hypothetical protein
MAKASAIIDSARYDLRDYGTGVNIGDTELLEYLNRMLQWYGQVLSNMESDWVYEVDTSTAAVIGQDYVAAPTDAHSVREVWIGTDKIDQVSVPEIYRKQKWYTGNAKPIFWALDSENIVFQQGSDDTHSLHIHYNQLPAIITDAASDDMPWNDRFNETIIQSLVIYSRAKKDDTVERPDQMIENMFRTRAMAETIRRNFVPKRYYIDF